VMDIRPVEAGMGDRFMTMVVLVWFSCAVSNGYGRALYAYEDGCAFRGT
jgi:hypothetical protein